MVDETKDIASYKAEDGTEFWVSVDNKGLHYITAKFPYITGSEKYRNNFVQYIYNDIKDEATAIGIAKFAKSCYERSLGHQKKKEVKYQVFLSTMYVGTFQLTDLVKKDKVLGTGSFIEANGDRYLVGNVMVRPDGDIVLEVSKAWKGKLKTVEDVCCEGEF